MRRVELLLKTVLDRLMALLGLALLSPLILLIIIAIYMKMGRPIIFGQERPGKSSRPFTMLKFRTMNDVRDRSGALLPDHERLTALGDVLRSTSLDEIPQLWNVLKGEMSLVGPRPLLKEYLQYYSEAQKRRHDMRPGVTGLAQVSGRNRLGWEDKLALDVWYVDNWSIGLDVEIFIKTFAAVLKGDGALRAEATPSQLYRRSGEV